MEMPMESEDMRSCAHPDEMRRLASELQLAVHRGGGSIDPDENPELRARLSSVILPYTRVHRILKDCEHYERGNETHCLPMDYGRQRVAMILKVRTRNLEAVKRRLINFLRQNKSRFFNRHFFKEAGIIEANYSRMNLSTFEMFAAIQEDAEWCQATSSSITDIEQKNVQFMCLPHDLDEVTRKLRHCGYKIIHTDQGYCTHKPLVNLTELEMQKYLQFVEELKLDEDVVRVYDNVRY